MIRLRPALTEEEVRKTGVAQIRQEYNKLAKDYNRIINGDVYLCQKCNEFHSVDAFYSDKKYASGLFPICKKCLIGMACDYDKKTNQYTDNREKTMKVLEMMDLPYIDSMYQSALTSCAEDVQDKHRNTAWSHYITVIKSLPNWRGKGWADSELPSDQFEEEVKINNKTLKNAVKRFGPGYTNEDYMFLENEYQDWITRYECNTKAQEAAFERLSFKKWEINNATKKGLPTKDLDKTYQEWLGTANIQPRQTSMDATADAQTFGTLIQKYEETRPLPEIDPDLEDVDKIGLLIDVFFRGHASKMLGLKNTFSHLYERFMKKYTVNKPEYDEDTDSETVFEKVFGSMEDD